MNFETYQLEQFLATLTPEDGLTLPIRADTIVIADKPDVRLHSQNGVVGIELTVSTDEERMRAMYLKLNDPRVQGVTTDSGLWDRAQPRPTDELIRAMQDRNAMWESAEAIWDRAYAKIIHCINRKVETLKKPGFETFDRNWLFVSDPLNEFSDRPMANCLDGHLKRHWLNGDFDHCPYDLLVLCVPSFAWKVRRAEKLTFQCLELKGRSWRDNVVGELPRQT